MICFIDFFFLIKKLEEGVVNYKFFVFYIDDFIYIYVFFSNFC